MEINEQLINNLRRIGLTQKEALVYSVLFELGGAYPSKVAELAKLNRSTTYKILEQLVLKGVVAELQKGKKLYYQVENPKKLEQFTAEQVRKAKNRAERVKGLIPDLQALYSLVPNKPKVKFFEGKKEILQLYEDHIEQKGKYEMLGISNTAELQKVLPQDFFRHYVKEKEKLGITSRGILPDREKDKSYNQTIYKGVEARFKPKLKFIPKKDFSYKSEITIYGQDKVSIVNFAEGDYVGVIIENKDLHNMMRMIFELAWEGVGKSAKR
ncbi:hypothetical protein COT97_03500 [Candidatus Falkowbacteria bacterium CG10_big_fil_rev_8_21_14_0_10_39_11]|uniref:Transcription regulator TrmB N-terminal domain-containing protein n=1 Tax=Candidatus Falkowbacteria bacterium CG10_big_fil_rev_8_21_14_0_10_39_11 TaxID=1974565 RepID=A0A2H0V4N3_9BACT|nr:MAG: hypothetical protein COT97_03500 [Candidatus Falkowbacteria bacterium CG10_big_fil_rev_8_21_14_0_10_39_11]